MFFAELMVWIGAFTGLLLLCGGVYSTITHKEDRPMGVVMCLFAIIILVLSVYLALAVDKEKDAKVLCAELGYTQYMQVEDVYYCVRSGSPLIMAIGE
jgi:hypothetical protein